MINDELIIMIGSVGVYSGLYVPVYKVTKALSINCIQQYADSRSSVSSSTYFEFLLLSCRMHSHSPLDCTP